MTTSSLPHGTWQDVARATGLLAPDGALAATIFAEMSALAVRTGAVNLGQGFPDTDGPTEVIEAAVSALRGGANQYPPGRGIPALREAIAAHQRRFYGQVVDPEREVLVTVGATEALTSAIAGLVGPGEEVLLLEPHYDSYPAAAALVGARTRCVPLRFPDYALDVDALADAVGPRTRMLVLNTPHNPTGRVLTRAELDAVADLAIRRDLIVVTDEVYEHLTFDGRAHVPLSTLPGMAERTVTVSSAGKTFNITGWKVGWAIGPAPLIDAATTVKQFLSFVSAAPLQPAVAVALGLGDDVYTAAATRLQAGRDALLPGLDAVGFHLAASEGTYFVVADCAPLGFDDAAQFCRRLPELAGVVGVPVGAFHHDPRAAGAGSLVRFAFCKRPEVIAEALTRLQGLTAVGPTGR